MILTFFSCLNALAITSHNLLKRSGKSWHPYLLQDTSGKVLSLSPLSLMSVMGLLSIYFITLRKFYSISSLLSVFIKCCILLSMLFASIDMIMCFLYFILLMRKIPLTDFLMLKHTYIPGINPTWA